MQQLSDIHTIKDILSRHGFTFSKSLGQNFLVNPSVCPRMAELCGADEDTGVMEIGPGIGVLTKELASRAKKVAAIELDSRLPEILSETLADYNNVSIIQGDVLKLDLQKIMREEFSGCKQVVVCANLPYYITSPVIMHLLEGRFPVKAVTVMVQKEAADRLCAQPGKRACGAVTLAVRYYAEPKTLFKVSRGSFMPAPKVDSAVIRLDIRQAPPVIVKDEQLLFRLIRAGFGQRRKTLPNCLSAGTDFSKEKIIAAALEIGISLTARAEELTLEQFGALADVLSINCPL